jgi:predicted metal-dependent HD superfamily phosphohydrolase
MLGYMNTHGDSWTRAWTGVGATGDGASVHAALLARYAEPHRAYHSRQHLTECLTAFEQVRSLAAHPAEVEVALWFHDAIYDLRRADNEALSADWAKAALLTAGAPPEAAERVSSLVLATKHTAAPKTQDEFVLIDVDLSILGAEQPRFAQYERQIRLEYNFVPAPVFAEKRRAILASILARPHIYNTAHFHAALEQRARQNLVRAIAQADPP